MLWYHMGWVDERGQPLTPPAVGKRLRSLVCVLACEAAGGDAEVASLGAVAVELAHNFSLIHDDVQDGDLTRRGRPTVWSIWGKEQAITAGDVMLCRARVVLHDLRRHLPAEAVLDIMSSLDRALVDLATGQYLDIEFERRPNVSVADYMEMVNLKTGSLMAAAGEVGARSANAAPRITESMRDFGRYLGAAFQMRDDVLGMWGSGAHTGKPVGADLKRRKKSLPVVYALQSSRPTQSPAGRLIRDIYDNPELETDLEAIRDALEELGADIYADEEIGRHTQAALSALRACGLTNAALDRLEALALALTERSA
jgi:geranylgeranyl diphosphate synthase type I